MSDVNIVVFSGRLVRPISEIRRIPGSNKPVCDFLMASNRKRRDKEDEDRNKYATFIKVTLWNQDAEFWGGAQEGHPALNTGDAVIVHGQLFDDNFERDDGTMTSGRIRIDNAHVSLLHKALPKDTEESPE
jgi:single-stranded DNA-binding protein